MRTCAAGRATFTVNGQGYAEFTARSILKFVTQLFLESEICSTCSASVQVVVESLQEAVANAIAESTVILEGSITDDESFASATGIASGEDPSTTANASALATGDRIEASTNGFAETVANVSVTGIANVRGLHRCMHAASVRNFQRQGPVVGWHLLSIRVAGAAIVLCCATADTHCNAPGIAERVHHWDP